MRSRGLKSRNHQVPNCKSQTHQRGYMLITLMLAVALMAIAMLAVLPATRLQVQRDREEELRHRGTAYMRAIQHFYKKFSRYPMRVEELENTNNLHFLRKRYKDPVNRDPVTGKERDFKFLNQQDITLNNGPVLGQTPAPGLPGGPGGGLPNAPGGLPGALGGLQSTGPTAPPTAANGDSGGTPENGAPNANGSSPGSSSDSASSSGLNGATFGGGPILGVASTSKAKSVRVFFQKDHYNDWLFIYVPQADQGGLLTGPINPNMQSGNLNGGVLPGQSPSTPQMPGVGANPDASDNRPSSTPKPGHAHPRHLRFQMEDRV